MNVAFELNYKPLKLINRSLLLLIFSFFGLVACSPLTRAEQPIHKGSVDLRANNRIEQTFVARYAGLEGIAIYLEPDHNRQSVIIRLSLYTYPEPQNLVETVELNLNQDSPAGFITFPFTTIRDSSRKAYLLSLTTVNEGQVLVGKAPGETYLNGALSIDGQFQDAQLAFKLIYDPVNVFLGLLFEFGTWGNRLLAGLVLFLLPGWGWLTFLYPKWDALDLLEKAGLSTGLSLAIYPLLFLWTDAIGIPLGSLYAWLPAVLGGIMVMIKYGLINSRSMKRNSQLALSTFLSSIHLPVRFQITDIILIIVIGLIIFSRFWAIRMIPAPLWGDSYHHTLITQLLVDNNGLFHAWEPYADLQSFTYHFGFHAIAAAFSWFTRLDALQAVLWTGQLINIFAVLTLYIMSMRITGDRRGGLMTLLISGLLLSMPMYYSNWGRYTQLAGHVVLIPAAIFLGNFLEDRRLDWKNLSMVSITMAGLFLTHYRVLIFLLLFYLINFLYMIRKINFKKQSLSTLLQGVIALILILPWLLRLNAGKLPFQFLQFVSTPASRVSSATLEYNLIGDLRLYLPVVMWWLIGAAVIYFLFRRNGNALILTFWWIAIFLMANPAYFGLPGTGILSNFAVLISAYIPASILVGAAIGDLPGRFELNASRGNSDTCLGSRSLSMRIASVMIGFLIIIIGLYGARLRLRDIKPSQHALVTYPDLYASEWIRNNLPQEAKFLVNSFFAYGGSLIVGSDAGWWLPLTSGRQTMLPPMPYVSEKGPWRDYISETNSLVELINGKGIRDQIVKDALAERHITHIYIGQQGGRVNAPSPPYLNPEKLLEDPDLAMIYHKDRVWIFEIIR